MVPVAGLEPARCRHRWILSPLRLPIPSHRQVCSSIVLHPGANCKYNLFNFLDGYRLPEQFPSADEIIGHLGNGAEQEGNREAGIQHT